MLFKHTHTRSLKENKIHMFTFEIHSYLHLVKWSSLYCRKSHIYLINLKLIYFISFSSKLILFDYQLYSQSHPTDQSSLMIVQMHLTYGRYEQKIVFLHINNCKTYSCLHKIKYGRSLFITSRSMSFGFRLRSFFLFFSLPSLSFFLSHSSHLGHLRNLKNSFS